MKPSYLKYYDRYSRWARLVFLADAIRARSRIRKLSLLNRWRDYARLVDDPRLMTLHRAMNEHLYEAACSWPAYDYGEGYFYQSFDRIAVSGLRNTEARVATMGLRDLLRGKRVLEIGCNSGFLTLSVADVVERIVAFDINPHLIAIARAVAEYLGLFRASFAVSSFESFACDQGFDVVLSLANHSTYDGNTRQGLEEYFGRCRDLLAPGGLLVFESHPPQHEGKGLPRVIELVGSFFNVSERRILDYGTFLDRGRTFILAERPCLPAEAVPAGNPTVWSDPVPACC